jgi:cytochrome-b5 reductase
MLAGGTGITPMYQVARAILENPEDKTKIHLIYANVTYDDILLKEDLDRFAREYPDQFKLYYVLNQPPTEWDGGVGFVSKGMIEANCPPPADDIQVTCAASPPNTLMCMSNCFPFCDGKKTQCYCSQFLQNGRLSSSIHHL